MPTPRLVQIQAWSYSRHADYNKCPALAKFKVIDRLREPDSPAFAKGNKVHALCEQYVTGHIKDLPTELERFRQEFLALRNAKAICEENWGFDRNWQACAWDDWKKCWLRIKVDAHYLVAKKKKKLMKTTGHIIDFKTGREYESHEEQRKLYALGMFLMYPDVESVVVEHWYLDQGVERKEEFLLKDVDELKAYWLRETTAMLNDTTFAPRPGDYCRFCHFRKANKGPCKF